MTHVTKQCGGTAVTPVQRGRCEIVMTGVTPECVRQRSLTGSGQLQRSVHEACLLGDQGPVTRKHKL